MIEGLQELLGLRAISLSASFGEGREVPDIPWLTRDVPGGERATELEAKADTLVNAPGVPLLAVFQYLLSGLDPKDSLAIIERHPLTLVFGRILENDAYRRPDRPSPA